MMILDEAHMIRNEDVATRRTLMEMTTQHRLALTGTPIQNSIADIINLLEFLNPTTFNLNRADKEMLENNELFDIEQLRALSNAIEPFIIRRLKGSELPPVHHLTFFCKYKIISYDYVSVRQNITHGISICILLLI